MYINCQEIDLGGTEAKLSAGMLKKNKLAEVWMNLQQQKCWKSVHRSSTKGFLFKKKNLY